MATLATYLASTRRLLHDSLGRYWTDVDLTAYINTARNRTVGDTSCNRQLQTIYISQGLELYTYGGVTGVNIISGGTLYTSAPGVVFTPTDGNGSGAAATAIVAGGAIASVNVTSVGTGYTSPPTVSFTGGGGSGANCVSSILNPTTLDTLNITLLWGQLRVILDRMPFTKFQSTIRAWQGYSQRPGVCSSYGQNSWFIGPIPDQSYVSEWDTVLTPSPLVNLTDVCIIGPQFQEPVAYYAAHQAKYQQQKLEDATKFLQLYQQKKNYANRSVMQRALPSAYGP